MLILLVTVLSQGPGKHCHQRCPPCVPPPHALCLSTASTCNCLGRVWTSSDGTEAGAGMRQSVRHGQADKPLAFQRTSGRSLVGVPARETEPRALSGQVWPADLPLSTLLPRPQPAARSPHVERVSRDHVSHARRVSAEGLTEQPAWGPLSAPWCVGKINFCLGAIGGECPSFRRPDTVLMIPLVFLSQTKATCMLF